ncbi:hypothetical protein GCM10028801_39440 [Nocardioides maradonensis]
MKVLRSVVSLVTIGVTLLLASALVVAGLWFYPVVALDHGGGSVPKCTPIVEFFQHNDQAEWEWSDLCYFPARRHVWLGVAGGLMVGGPGLALLIVGGRRASRDRKKPSASELRTSSSD